MDTYGYNDKGDRVSETTLDGTTNYVYDNLGRLIQVTEPDPDGPGYVQASQTTYFYDEVGNMVVVYDGYRAPWQNVNPLDVADDGRLGASLSDFSAFVSMFGLSHEGPFDPNHNGKYGDLDGDGDVDNDDFALFEAGFGYTGEFPTEFTIAGHVTEYEYDNLGRVTKQTDAGGGETTYTYDANGNRLTLTDPVGNTTTWTYDALNRMLTNTNELNDTRTYEYDAAGNVIEYTDRNGRVTTYEYDNLQRRTAEKWMDGVNAVRTLTYVYDAASQLIEATDPAATYTFTYDNLGRNTSTVHDLAALGFDVVIDEAYDALGRRVSLAAEIDGTADLVNSYTYDLHNRMTQVTQSGQTGGNAVAEKRVDFAYDADNKGLFTSIARYADLAGTELVATSSYQYDDADNLTSLTHTDSSTATLAGYTWRYDSAYRLTQFTVIGHPDEDVIYTHDATNQLIEADRGGTANDEEYSYDANGNRTNSGYSTGTNNQLLTDGTYNYTYDDEGNRLTKTNIATGELIEYEWDYRNRLTSIVTKDSLGVVTHSVDYVYDLFGRRIGKIIDADGAGSGTAVEEIYIYDGLREERGNAGDHILLAFDETDVLTKRMLYGPNVDQILAQEDVDSLLLDGETLWALTDHQGSVRDVVTYDVIANTTAVENHIVYDAFGQITAESDPSVVLLVAFTGRERDLESDLQYNRFRYYDAVIGRWISEDPITFSAGDSNLRRYLGNSPSVDVDPSGLERPRVPGIPPEPARGWGDAAGVAWWKGWNWNTRQYRDSIKRATCRVANDGEHPNHVGNVINDGFSDVGSTAEDVIAGVQEIGAGVIIIGSLFIPGPEDAILAAAAVKIGARELKIVGNELLIGGKQLVGRERDQALQAISDASREYFEANPPHVIQQGGHTIAEQTRRALGLTRQQTKCAIEGLKEVLGQGASNHRHKILSNGNVIDKDTGELLGNLYDYIF